MDDKEILLALGRLEGKVDALIAQHKAIASDLDRHDTRLRVLENSKAYLMGICAVIAAGSSYVFKLITGE